MRTMKVNALSVFLAIKHAAEAMKKAGKGGSIIATASVAGIRAGAGGSDYSASKAAVINLVQTSAWQLSGTNIRGIHHNSLFDYSQCAVSGLN
jgi:NAD(P)-dependent dehydrogenase (short-subunit alcohol dehydrogenase family)